MHLTHHGPFTLLALLACLALAAPAWADAVPAPVHPPALVAGAPDAVFRLADAPPPPDGDRGIDALSYDLDLVLDPATASLSGEVRMGFAALADGLDSLRLDLVPELVVTGVERRGLPAGFRHAGEALVIALDPPPAAGSADTVLIRWQGRPPRHGPFAAGLMFRTHDAGTREDRSDDVPIVANVSQPWSAHAWWPCKDLPGDKALVSTVVTAPDTLSVMANGTLEAAGAPSAGLRTWRWRERYPIAPYLVSVAVSNYVRWDEDCAPDHGDPVPLAFLVFPQDSAAAAVDFAPTCEMLDMMTGIAGPWPFPGEKYAQAEIKWVGAMEHQTATSYSQVLLTGDGYWQSFVIHELAHQWFGDSLTPSHWRHIWLNEGFARYCEALWAERTGGPDAYRAFMLAIGPRRHADLFTEQGLLGDPDPVLPNLLVYDKGAWLLHSLRQLVGDEAFFRFLRSYAGDPELAHGLVDDRDAIAAAEQACGCDLDPFFDAWLGTTAVLRLQAQWSAAPTAGGGALVRLELSQLQDPVIPTAVPVEIRTTGPTYRRTLIMDERTAVFSLPAPAPVRGVVVDPNSTVLGTSGAPPAALVRAEGPWPNPVPAGGASFTVTAAGGGVVTVRVLDARGRRIAADAFGPLLPGEAAPWRWEPIDDDGRPLPSGPVWLEFRSGAGRAVRRAMILH